MIVKIVSTYRRWTKWTLRSIIQVREVTVKGFYFVLAMPKLMITFLKHDALQYLKL